jgi:hypothetical protein
MSVVADMRPRRRRPSRRDSVGKHPIAMRSLWPLHLRWRTPSLRQRWRTGRRARTAGQPGIGAGVAPAWAPSRDGAVTVADSHGRARAKPRALPVRHCASQHLGSPIAVRHERPQVAGRRPSKGIAARHEPHSTRLVGTRPPGSPGHPNDDGPRANPEQECPTEGTRPNDVCAQQAIAQGDRSDR